MCLYLYEGRFIAKRANKDIKCYKFFYAESIKENSILTPFTHTEMPINIPIKDKNKVKIEKDANEDFLIGKGVFHSYCFEEDVFMDGKFFSQLKAGFIVLECIIPKGSRYYEGYFGESNCYGSKGIIITNKVLGGNVDFEKMKEKVSFLDFSCAEQE